MAERKKPQKPYPGYPLFYHATGQWAKKVRGKLHYFGTDADNALAKWQAQRDDLMAGRKPRDPSDVGVTLRDLLNRFLTAKRRLMDAGELSTRTFCEYFDVAELLVDQFGATRQVADLRGDDFEALRGRLASTNGPVKLASRIQCVRTIFKFGFDDELLEKPVRFGAMFKKPSRRLARQARHDAGPRMFEADDIRRLIDAAGIHLRAMILLGVNAGFGQTDVAALPMSALDLERGWLNFPRPKTAIMRRVPLWPETINALRESLAKRPTPHEDADAGLAFVTKYGHAWLRVRERADKPGKIVIIDSIGLEFGKLVKALSLEQSGRRFYALRRSFRTIADASKDQPAIDSIMGHADDSMASHYRERIDDTRLRAVADHVRQWLFAVPEPNAE